MRGIECVETIEIGMFYNRCKLKHIKQNKSDCINHSMVRWFQDDQKYVLLFHIPTPLEVLEMQANGSRVISLLVEKSQLSSMHTSNLSYMAGEKQHAKDVLEFLVHDIRHMYHFSDPIYYHEQVGLFNALWSLSGGFFSFFSSLPYFDHIFWKELEYAISDMNCVCVHILSYIKAKWLLSVGRFPLSCTSSSSSSSSSSSECSISMTNDMIFEPIWTNFLILLGFEPDSQSFVAARHLSAQSTQNDIENIRDFFKMRGQSVIVH